MICGQMYAIFIIFWIYLLFQSFIKEGILKKLSRKEMQPRMFYLVSLSVCLVFSGENNILIDKQNSKITRGILK